MRADDIRSRFISFFRENGHTVVESGPLVPKEDPTLLFANAGMVQFKATFLGKAPRPYTRAVSSQKCMRVDGKHNDLDQVGRTARHHTFFEMLGNFSFGDYFKEDAILYAWTLITEIFQLPKERLWATLYEDDDAAQTLWERYLPANRIVRLGKKDNFWQMGATGPCGPCSEIMVDQGEAIHPDCPGIGVCDCDRYLEVWNLVFMQYNQDAAGLSPLPDPSIDTGMGLERISAVCQGVLSNYETDLFTPIFKALASKIGKTAEETRGLMPARVVADHLRAMTFLMSDGVIPSNEGRGYVLRRIIRRAARFGTKIGLSSSPMLHALTPIVIDSMRGAYPELALSQKKIDQVVQREEEQFSETLKQGSLRLEEIIQKTKKEGSCIPGETIFKLYDTYGYPMDMALEVAHEAGLTINEAEFHAAMAVQKERARQSWVGPTSEASLAGPPSGIEPTLFTGYEHLSGEGTLLGILKENQWVTAASGGDDVDLVFDTTPFYSEGGGQVGDCGTLTAQNGQAVITATRRSAEGIYLHRATITAGTLLLGTRVHLAVNTKARQDAARNHTATHLLHAVLRNTFGDHLKQEGSLVAPDRLRFDFFHFSPLSQGELDRVEAQVNEWILQAVPVGTQILSLLEATSSGAMALFGEKYGDSVRVVSVSDFSRELCGGTHCSNTGQIGLFKIVREGSVSAGIRRIEAVTGDFSYRLAKKEKAALHTVADILKSSPEAVIEKATQRMAQLKEQDRTIQALKTAPSAMDPLSAVCKVGSVPVLVEKIPPSEIKTVRAHADRLRDRLKSGIVIVGAGDEGGEKASLVVMVTPDWVGRYPASAIAAQLAVHIGGTGGGKPEMAQAGGKNVAMLDAALKQSMSIITAMGN